jgi:hypothetical protein
LGLPGLDHADRGVIQRKSAAGERIVRGNGDHSRWSRPGLVQAVRFTARLAGANPLGYGTEYIRVLPP